MTIIGLDNGVTGTVGIYNAKKGINELVKTPVNSFKEMDSHLKRISMNKLIYLIAENKPTFIIIEKMMKNAGRFAASISAARAHEATIIAIETLKLPYLVISAVSWQSPLIGKVEDTKLASMMLAEKLFDTTFPGCHDADGLLIAYYGAHFCQLIDNKVISFKKPINMIKTEHQKFINYYKDFNGQK